jgi:hypothetical protein
VLSVAADDPERAHDDTGQLIMGTPLYLAPEMAEGHRPDGRADLYALGAMLYHLLCGQPPFEHDDPTEVVRLHMREAVPPLESRHPELPEPLYTLVAACLEKNPEHRPADAQAVIDALTVVSDALAAAGDADESLRQAAVPPIPGTGLPSDWRYLHTVLGRYVAMIWRDRPLPAGLRDALEWAEDARLAVDTAHGALELRRERADGLARVRIAAQSRLDAQRRDLARALEAGEVQLRAAQRAIEEAQVELTLFDDRYRTLLAGLTGREARGFDGFDVDRVSALRRPVRGLLAARNEADGRLAQARGLEREAVEHLALLHAESLEVESAHQELRLREQDEERRAELMADTAADATVTAQRAYENACLQLFTEYVEQAASRLRGTLPGV